MSAAFEESMRALAKRAESVHGKIFTEEATKTALVMPFLQALGYDVFDPSIVIPEFNADHGIKKGEKVDYAIKIGEEIRMLIECKSIDTVLQNTGASQLFRYFSVTNARIGLLTNGIEYRFFSDLDNQNKMDSQPFFVFHLTDATAASLFELKKFRAEQFAIDQILSSANDLKYLSLIKAEINREIENPSNELTEIMARRIYSGRLTSQIREWFAGLMMRAMREALRDRLNQRLTDAIMKPDEGLSLAPTEGPLDKNEPDDIVTTPEEIEAFHIIRAIARKYVSVSRVHMRDAKSYCAILLDDNNRKPICRLYFNGRKKRIGVFFGKEEKKFEIENLDEVYDHAAAIEKSVMELDQKLSS